MPSILLVIESIGPFQLIILERQFQKIQNKFRNSSFRFCSSRTNLGTKICISQGPIRKTEAAEYMHVDRKRHTQKGLLIEPAVSSPASSLISALSS